MENSQLCKLFIGGLNVQTTEAGLREHFAAYGTLTDCVVVLNPQTKRSRCFGFVTYSAVEEADAAMAASPHAVDGNAVELKRAVSREDSAKPGAHAKVKKLFVGGLKGDVGEGDLVQHFSQFGPVEKAEIIADKQSGKKRGFGFVYFQNHDAADKAAVVKFHPIQGHRVEVKKAVPKEDIQAGGGGGGSSRPSGEAEGRKGSGRRRQPGSQRSFQRRRRLQQLRRLRRGWRRRVRLLWQRFLRRRRRRRLRQRVRRVRQLQPAPVLLRPHEER
uniref:Heterogeneous nuclear ribonucleoprotein A0 n=1 Tax=Malurus cyaneus samueli TaxID=2593467 RepID=A0A8C5X8S9_9PASS